jgi:hypothetical protein
MNRNSELDKAYEDMGKKNENLYKPIIAELYGIVYKTAYKYCVTDFLGETFCGELKSRDLSVDEFYETMIGYNKIEDGFKKLDWYKDHMPNYKVYLWFAFREGLYAWELNRKNYDLNGGDKQKRIGGTSNRGRDDYKDHYYIKKEHMVKVSDVPVWIHPLVAENSRIREEKKKKLYSQRVRNALPEGVCFLTLNGTIPLNSTFSKG